MRLFFFSNNSLLVRLEKLHLSIWSLCQSLCHKDLPTYAKRLLSTWELYWQRPVCVVCNFIHRLVGTYRLTKKTVWRTLTFLMFCFSKCLQWVLATLTLPLCLQNRQKQDENVKKKEKNDSNVSASKHLNNTMHDQNNASVAKGEACCLARTSSKCYLKIETNGVVSMIK